MFELKKFTDAELESLKAALEEEINQRKVDKVVASINTHIVLDQMGALSDEAKRCFNCKLHEHLQLIPSDALVKLVKSLMKHTMNYDDHLIEHGQRCAMKKFYKCLGSFTVDGTTILDTAIIASESDEIVYVYFVEEFGLHPVNDSLTTAWEEDHEEWKSSNQSIRLHVLYMNGIRIATFMPDIDPGDTTFTWEWDGTTALALYKELVPQAFRHKQPAS